MNDIVLRVTPVVHEVKVQRAGITGPRGPAGGAGDGGGTAYMHTQASASTIWNIAHELGYFPNVTAAQLSGLDDWEVIEGDVLYLDENTIRITFSAAVSGRAFCS